MVVSELCVCHCWAWAGPGQSLLQVPGWSPPAHPSACAGWAGTGDTGDCPHHRDTLSTCSSISLCCQHQPGWGSARGCTDPQLLRDGQTALQRGRQTPLQNKHLSRGMDKLLSRTNSPPAWPGTPQGEGECAIAACSAVMFPHFILPRELQPCYHSGPASQHPRLQHHTNISATSSINFTKKPSQDFQVFSFLA